MPVQTVIMRYCIVVFLSLSFCIACRQQALSADAVKADFDTLVSALREAHGGIYRFADSVTVNERFAGYRKQLDNVKDIRGLIAVLSKLLASTGDGHLRLEYDSATNAWLSALPLFPLRLIWDKQDLKVLYIDLDGNTTIKPGAIIKTINGRPITSIVRSIMPAISGDGFIETGKRWRLERGFPLMYWYCVEPAEKFTIGYIDDHGREQVVTLPGVTNAQRIANRNSNPVNARLLADMARIEGPTRNITLDIKPECAHLRIRSFEGNNFLTQLDSSFSAIMEAKSRALILDMRGNGGGTDDWGAKLVSYFVDTPFRYFDHIRMPTITPSFTTFKPATVESLRNGTVPDGKGGFLVTDLRHKGVDIQQPAAIPFTGKLIVLIDGGSFSTTADVSAQLSHLTKAIFIGEETAGGYQGNTSGHNAMIKLPNSQLIVRVYMYDYWNAVPAPREKGRGTIPHIIVPKTMNDLLQGKDAQMEAAVALVKQ